MRTIRRLYFYAVALASLEVVVWGVIGLARTVLATSLVGGRTSPLAQSLALTLVGIPVFLIHWTVIQRDARQDPGERSAQLRALLLYGALLGLLIPVAQNGLALFNRLTLVILHLDPTQAVVGGLQSWSDNLVAIAINAGAAVYLGRILVMDRSSGVGGEPFDAVRRLYRIIWLVYGLILVVFGVQEVLRFLLFVPVGIGGNPGYRLANALALLLVGLPLWVGWERVIWGSLTAAVERESLLRLVVLYLLVLAGVGIVLGTAGIVLAAVLRVALGAATTFPDFLNAVSPSLSISIPMGGVWGYYSRQLNRAIAALSEAPRKAGLDRLYHYLLASVGFGATFFALQQLLRYIVDLLTGLPVGTLSSIHQLANALAALSVGLPLWLLTWQPMQAQARDPGTAGDHARRSIIRKAALYLALFALVIGAMISAGELVYQGLTHLLGSPVPYFVSDEFTWLLTCLLFLVWFIYYLQILREDSRIAERNLAELHRAFPLLLIDPGDDRLAEEVRAALRRHAPEIPLTVHLLAQGVVSGEIGAPCAVILPSGLAVHPPEDLRTWLEAYSGQRIIIPDREEGYVWLGSSSLSPTELARQAAIALRQMAEGQPLRISPPANAWMITSYVLGGLFGLLLIFLLATLVASSFTR